jgi:hypothetical protein
MAEFPPPGQLVASNNGPGFEQDPGRAAIVYHMNSGLVQAHERPHTDCVPPPDDDVEERVQEFYAEHGLGMQYRHCAGCGARHRQSEGDVCNVADLLHLALPDEAARDWLNLAVEPRRAFHVYISGGPEPVPYAAAPSLLDEVGCGFFCKFCQGAKLGSKHSRFVDFDYPWKRFRPKSAHAQGRANHEDSPNLKKIDSKVFFLFRS